MSEVTVEQAMKIAIQHHQQGKLADAEAIYRAVIAQNANHVDALHLLGVLLDQIGQSQAAIELITLAIQKLPNHSGMHLNLANALRNAGQWVLAVPEYQRAIMLDSKNIGAINNLADLFRTQRQYDHAARLCQDAISLSPYFAEAHNNLGLIFLDSGKPSEAIDCFEKALSIQPEYFIARYNLANAYLASGQLDQAIAAYKQILLTHPNHPQTLNNLGNAHRDNGDLQAAISIYQSAIIQHPEYQTLHDNLLYALPFAPGYSARMIHAELQVWNQRFAEPLQTFIQSYRNSLDPNRRLRIGYVSPDFYGQAESFFVVPLLESHDRSQFEIHCYASVRRTDATTARIRAATENWHNVLDLTDHALADRIRQDQIDILIDLTMHMSNNRLMAFAEKPAPVQITWLAYPGSTGMKSIDYRITDRYLDPIDSDLSVYSEESLLLDPGWICYNPLADYPPAAMRDSDAPICFGSLNHPAKLNPQLLSIYSKVLQATPDSQILLTGASQSHRDRVLKILTAENISADRVKFAPRLDRAGYLRLYDQIDLCLDTLPYNGITTTCDALWMGIPVVTQVGSTAPGRAGSGILSLAGMNELIAQSAEQFVTICSDLARDRDQLMKYRQSLRQRISDSSLMNAPQFARTMESTYRTVWKKWCDQSR